MVYAENSGRASGRLAGLQKSMSEPLSAREPALHAMLRSETAAAHSRLESVLALLDPPLTRERFLTVLQGFWGFHRVWEPLLAERRELAALLTGRSKLAILEHDLEALGMTRAGIEALPLCLEASRLGGSAMRMLGGVYVLEGSTLGGQVIGKALQGAAWVPENGLQYFNPYGARTGAMWRTLRAALDTASAPAADEEIISGAQDSFALLQDWLGGRLSK